MASQSPDSGPLVLVVEDNPTNMMLTRAVLRRAGYQTAEATSADEALERLRTVRPEIILMDVQLPGQDGLSLTRQLKANPATANIRIIALTAHAMKEDRTRIIGAGCDGYIPKPINTRTFASDLAAALEQTSTVV